LRERLIDAHQRESSVIARLIGRLGHARPAQKGLYLWGSVGRGKTWLMDLFYHSLPFPERRRRHFHRFMYEVHAQLRTLQHQQSPLEVLAQRISEDCRVLCFDELFVSDIADAMILGGLLEGLFNHGVSLVATSNTRPRDLYKDGLQRARFLPAIASIEQNTEVVSMGGRTDYRLRRLTQAGIYVKAGAPDTWHRLQRLFAELADGDAAAHEQPDETARDGTIEIEGRSIPVIRQNQSIVWFSFSALCTGPRSQNDYIEIARNYSSVIVSDVPVLDADHENEARRFIALVDELYDHHVNLIISADAPPNELYRGERLTQQFERTASRLIEMQSEEYLASEHIP
jgi:cell division protein ZapE